VFLGALQIAINCCLSKLNDDDDDDERKGKERLSIKRSKTSTH